LCSEHERTVVPSGPKGKGALDCVNLSRAATLANAMSTDRGATRDGPASKSSAPANAKGRVLVADDEAGLVRVYRRVLMAAGYAVDVAGDGAEAAERIESKEYDAIVSDISMPGMDGLEL